MIQTSSSSSSFRQIRPSWMWNTEYPDEYRGCCGKGQKKRKKMRMVSAMNEGKEGREKKKKKKKKEEEERRNRDT